MLKQRADRTVLQQIAGHAAEHPFAQAAVALGAATIRSAACPRRSTSDVAGVLGGRFRAGRGSDAVALQPRRDIATRRAAASLSRGSDTTSTTYVPNPRQQRQCRGGSPRAWGVSFQASRARFSGRQVWLGGTISTGRAACITASPISSDCCGKNTASSSGRPTITRSRHAPLWRGNRGIGGGGAPFRHAAAGLSASRNRASQRSMASFNCTYWLPARSRRPCPRDGPACWAGRT